MQTEFDFTLPKGFVDSHGTLHRRGTMRLATARDEIEPLRDQRVSGPDDPFLTVVVLSRVVTRLGTISQVTPREIENLFAADLAYLQDLYGIINFGTADELNELRRSTMPPEQAPEPAPAPAAFDGGDASDVDDDEDDDAIVMAPPRGRSIQEVRSSAVE
ncbi:MAG TPA: hypothetical protein VEA78_06375 [Acidimicrobiales bacterium]|nr:hypothetical protein [Acidimicrobiales bacterium]